MKPKTSLHWKFITQMFESTSNMVNRCSVIPASLKNTLICVWRLMKSYGFGTTQGWVIDSRVFILGELSLCCCIHIVDISQDIKTLKWGLKWMIHPKNEKYPGLKITYFFGCAVPLRAVQCIVQWIKQHTVQLTNNLKVVSCKNHAPWTFNPGHRPSILYLFKIYIV